MNVMSVVNLLFTAPGNRTLEASIYQHRLPFVDNSLRLQRGDMFISFTYRSEPGR